MLRRVTLIYVTLHCDTLRYITLRYVKLGMRYVIFHFVSLDCITLHCKILPCIVLHFYISYCRYVGVTSSAYQKTILNPKLNYRSKCSQIDVFETSQRALCTRAKNLLEVLSRGATLGIEECQHQFRHRRWNCTTYNNRTDVFGNILSRSESVVKKVNRLNGLLGHWNLWWNGRERMQFHAWKCLTGQCRRKSISGVKLLDYQMANTGPY